MKTTWPALQSPLSPPVSSQSASSQPPVSSQSGGLTQLAGQAEVDDLDLDVGGVDAHDVLGLEVQVHDVLLVHVLHALQDLLHVAHAGGLRVLEALVHDALKQLTACDAGGREVLFDLTEGRLLYLGQATTGERYATYKPVMIGPLLHFHCVEV